MRLDGMKLFSGGRAPNPRRVAIFLKEKGLEVETIELDLNKLEQRAPEFAAINPMMTLPVLVLADGTVITESVAISRYLESVKPEPPLLGVDALDAAIVEMWQRRAELNFMLPVSFAFRHLHPGGAILEGVQIPEWGEIGQGRARRFMEFIDSELSRREFIAGDRFTIADITAIVTYQFLRAGKMEPPADLPNLKRWADAVGARPSVQVRK
jgi:glutathione S-transferase